VRNITPVCIPREGCSSGNGAAREFSDRRWREHLADEDGLEVGERHCDADASGGVVEPHAETKAHGSESGGGSTLGTWCSWMKFPCLV